MMSYIVVRESKIEGAQIEVETLVHQGPHPNVRGV